ncbi:MAG: hypothetical protein HZY76_13585 [Anaerolineae bacterium]|nr:MAG: hypothetical protein HZY76_13585 [Anaerolineae bacterium]
MAYPHRWERHRNRCTFRERRHFERRNRANGRGQCCTAPDGQPAERHAPGVNPTKKQKIWLTIGVILAVILITLAIYFLFRHPVFTATLRDILIIVLTFEVLVIGCLLAVLVYQIYLLSYFLYTEIGPVLAATQDTVGTVKGTATFVSGQVVNPAIRASATVTRWRRTIEVLLGR